MKLFSYHSPIGELSCLLEGDRLVELIFGGYPGYTLPIDETSGLGQELELYFAGRLREFRQEISLLGGTAFEREVWLCLKEIPYGETRSYQWIARRVGRPNAARAVGQAVGKNPISIILPCHRVIPSGGGLGGYSAGQDVKKWLLRLEGAI